MKKMILGFALISAMALTVSVFASPRQTNSQVTTNNEFVTKASAQGSHCTGTVGCSCPGFSPNTSGDVWQQSYCKRCGHKKSCHK